MMRERAVVAGGTFSITSHPGKGSVVTARFPRVWVEEGSLLEAEGSTRDSESGKVPVGTATGPGATPIAPSAPANLYGGADGSIRKLRAALVRHGRKQNGAPGPDDDESWRPAIPA